PSRRPVRGPAVPGHRESPVGTSPASTSLFGCSRAGRQWTARPERGARELRVGGHRTVCGHASGTGHLRPARGRCRQESPDENREQFRRGRELGVSCDHLLRRARVAVELAEQRISIFLSPVGQLLDKVLDLFPGGIPQGLRAAEVDGVGLYEFGVELMLANDLAQAISDLGPSAVAIATGALWRELLSGGWNCSDFLDRADADAVGL